MRGEDFQQWGMQGALSLIVIFLSITHLESKLNWELSMFSKRRFKNKGRQGGGGGGRVAFHGHAFAPRAARWSQRYPQHLSTCSGLKVDF